MYRLSVIGFLFILMSFSCTQSNVPDENPYANSIEVETREFQLPPLKLTEDTFEFMPQDPQELLEHEDVVFEEELGSDTDTEDGITLPDYYGDTLRVRGRNFYHLYSKADSGLIKQRAILLGESIFKEWNDIFLMTRKDIIEKWGNPSYDSASLIYYSNNMITVMIDFDNDGKTIEARVQREP